VPSNIGLPVKVVLLAVGANVQEHLHVDLSYGELSVITVPLHRLLHAACHTQRVYIVLFLSRTFDLYANLCPVGVMQRLYTPSPNRVSTSRCRADLLAHACGVCPTAADWSYKTNTIFLPIQLIHPSCSSQ
jgi:hypothetical protein